MSERPRSSLAQTACRHCREHKIRCSRHVPQCTKCAKTNVTCSYPEPPNRHLIAVRREIRKRNAAQNESTDETNSPHGSTQATSRAHNLYTPPSQREEPSQSPGEINVRSLSSLSPTTHTLLQDTYFSCMYNSTLTLHRPTFERKFAGGNFPEHVLQAMYAMAVRLLPCSPRYHGSIADLRDLGNSRQTSIAWATQAGKTALQTIDQPTLPALQTCLILALFWFSCGDAGRNTMFSAIAYRAAKCMLEDHELETFENDEHWRLPSPQYETLRRCFWAAWSIHCINSDQSVNPVINSSTRSQVMSVPLPVSEKAFAEGQHEDCGTLGRKINLSNQKTPSIMAHLMDLALLWARVRDDIDARRSKPETATWNNAFVLYDEIKRWKSQLHPALTYSKERLHEQLIIQQQPVYLLLSVLHHQCCLVLHASLLPCLSGSLSQDRTPSEVAKISADIALTHADQLSELAADLLELDVGANCVAPFVGYSMYVAATVHLIVMARDSTMTESARGNLVTCLRLLRSMKPYWAMLEKLWKRIERLYLLQVSNIGNLMSPQSTGATSVSTVQSREIERLIDHDAEARSVNNVVHDSVLHFSLRRLQRASSRSNDDSPVSGKSALDDMLDRSPPVDLQDHNNYNAFSTAGPVTDPSEAAYPTLATMAESDFAAPDLQSMSFDNWWEWSIDDIDQIPFDLFEMPTTS